jgi:putative Holliday junction resolvase
VGRILAIDPGDVRIGLAVCDPSGTIARPLKILPHRSRAIDARAIADEASAIGAERILVGLALDEQAQPGPQARKAMRLVDALRSATSLPIDTWDETGTTQQALHLPGGHGEPLDARAAAVLLQEYLDAQA